MKHLLFFLLLTLKSYAEITLPIDSATKKVSFSYVFYVDSTMNADQVYKLGKQWFSSNTSTFNRSNSDKVYAFDTWFMDSRNNTIELDQLYKSDQVLKFYDDEKKKLIGKGMLKYTAGQVGCLRLLYWQFDVNFAAKDGRYRIELTNFTYNHYNQVKLRKSQISGFADNGICNASNTMENFILCTTCPNEFDRFYSFFVFDMQNLVKSLKSYINDARSQNDKW